MERFLARAPFETVVTPKLIENGLFEIRDELDHPVLYSAVVGFADVLVTGDKDFADVDVEKAGHRHPRPIPRALRKLA